MENLCKSFQESGYSFTELEICPCDEAPFDVQKLGKKYNMTLLYYDESLKKSNNFGPELFIRKVDNRLIAHSNPAKATKLPAGVGKIKGATSIDSLTKKRCSSRNWSKLERILGRGLDIWKKETIGLNKSIVKNVRMSKLRPALNVHFDTKFEKLFLITCPKTYFRGNLRKINVCL